MITNNPQYILLFSSIVSILLFTVGCNNTENEKSVLLIDELNSEVKTLTTENLQLKKKISDHEEQLKTFKIQHKSLTIENNDLKEWTDQIVDKFGPSVWYFGDYERPLPYIKVETANPHTLIMKLNRFFKKSGDPEIRIINIKDEVASVILDDASHLTQRMGSTGARSYMNSVLYTLTSLKSITCVMFNFESGDHAYPGKYCR